MNHNTYFFNSGMSTHRIVASNVGMYDAVFTWFADGFYRVQIMMCNKLFDVKCVVDDFGNLVAVE